MKSGDWGPWLSGGLFILIGAVLIYQAIEPSTEGEYAPPWVIAASGAVFAVAGLAVLVEILPELRTMPELKARLHSGLGIAMVLLFALMANWIAFGPGERTGEVSVSLPVIGFSTQRADWLFRAPFACSAAFLDFLLVLLLAREVQGALRQKR